MTTKDEVKALWKLCFTDSDEFTDLYFDLRYKDDINMAVREEGKIISALQMISYPMTFCGETIATSYVSGVCTSRLQVAWSHAAIVEADASSHV